MEQRLTLVRLLNTSIRSLRVTLCQDEEPGGIALDDDLMARAGLLPLDLVEVENRDSGERWSSHVLPALPGSGELRLGGGDAARCFPGDELILRSYVERPIADVECFGHRSSILVVDEHNIERNLLHRVIQPTTFPPDPRPLLQQTLPR